MRLLFPGCGHGGEGSRQAVASFSNGVSETKILVLMEAPRKAGKGRWIGLLVGALQGNVG